MDNVTEAASSPDRSPDSVPTLLTANPASPSHEPAPTGSDALQFPINPGTPNTGTPTTPASPPVESPVSPPSPPKAKGPVFPWPFAATSCPPCPKPLQPCSPHPTSQPPTSQPTPSLCQSNTQQHRCSPSPSSCCQPKLHRCSPSPSSWCQSRAHANPSHKQASNPTFTPRHLLEPRRWHHRPASTQRFSPTSPPARHFRFHPRPHPPLECTFRDSRS